LQENKSNNGWEIVQDVEMDGELQLQQKVEQNLRSGKIKRLHLTNFMCHTNFEIKMNQNVNIIVGLNGSGKSAILTAIAIGLGSKATATSRSTNLKDLVKRGETSAVIDVTLSNDGIDAFERKLQLIALSFIIIF
jgi:chromosome segregation ATPase